MTPDIQPQTLRLFVAAELPEAWTSALGDVQAAMRASLAADPQTRDVHVRWVHPEGIHLTLKFLGAVVSDRVAEIERVLASAVPEAPAITLRLGHVGSFSDRRAPRVIWAGVDGDVEELQRLAARIDSWLTTIGFARERRGFTPHLTLARLPEELAQPTRERVSELTRRHQLPALPDFEIERVSLMRSHLGPTGARYERLSAVPPLPLQSQGDDL